MVHDLWVQGENHIFLKDDFALCANGRILEHGCANAMAGEVPERETVFAEFLGTHLMHMAGEFARAHELSRGFQRFRVSIRHRFPTRTDLPPNERSRELHPTTNCA